MSEGKVDYRAILKEIEKGLLSPDMIQDNTIHFMHEKNLYRVKMPKQKVNAEADIKKNELYVQLIQNDNSIMENKLLNVLKKKQGIDIEEMRKKQKDLEEELKDKYIDLAKKRDNQKEKINELKKEIARIREEHSIIAMDIAKHLSPTIETQVKNFYMEYLTSKCTEKYIEEKNKKGNIVGKWSLVWNTDEDYKEDDSSLRYKAIGYLTHLLLNTRG